MPDGTIVRAWREGGTAYMAVRVVEGAGPVEYVGSVPAVELAGLTAAQRRARLATAVKAVRDAQEGPQDLGLSGTVTV